MTDSPRPGLQPYSHLKAGPTTSSSRSTALPSNKPPLTRPSSRLRTQRSSAREETIDPTSEKATLAFIRRVLCPQTSHGASSPQPPEELLPPLTSSNDVDRQLYALIAIIIKEFLYSWYSKITSDQALVNEVLQVVAHCTRALEQRIRQIDVAQLVLDDIPALVEAHILSYRLAKQQSHLSGLPTSHRTIYHELNPHPGLSPIPDPADPDTIGAQSENEAIYRRLLANGTLAVLLPTEDLENSSLRTLVSDVMADLILGKEVAGRICEGRFFWEITTKLATMATAKNHQTTGPQGSDSPANTPTSQLEKFGLLHQQDDSPAPQHSATPSQITVWIWSVLQGIYFGYVALRFIATGLFRVASHPGPGDSHGAGVSFPAATPGTQKDGLESSSDGVGRKRPVLDYRVSSMASQLLGLSQRMPWLSGFFALVQHLVVAGPGQLGDTDGVLDRFLRETIEEYVLTPTLLPNLLLATRTALFPANARPQAPAVNTGGPPAPTPQVSVQTRALAAAAPIPAEGNGAALKPHIGNTLNKGATGETLKSNKNVEVGRSGDHLSRAVSPEPTSPALTNSPSLTVDTTTTPSGIKDSGAGTPTTRSEKKQDPTRPNSEIAAIKRRCAASLLALIPRAVARTFFAASALSSDRSCIVATGSSSSVMTLSPPSSRDEEGGGVARSEQVASTSLPFGLASGLSEEGGRLETGEQQPELEELFLLQSIEDVLDVFADEYCNKHLIYSIIEKVLSKVLPELAERSVQDLMEDRGVAPVPAGF
ncbi:hypothetical protein N7532_010589 [Penicillium argentinense]|uniref:PXA domain-containing protein n=1 Tax=Penicillium argentinense TaxID=1131581 RepID=A0A9W9EPW3_9EURO|nr:uncharacterized protein N7532_010589 [Penicillium argentinense]KAJ5085818.1 hypothetical protein N7532_010589 [Penicillium argentinense]